MHNERGCMAKTRRPKQENRNARKFLEAIVEILRNPHYLLFCGKCTFTVSVNRVSKLLVRVSYSMFSRSFSSFAKLLHTVISILLMGV